MSDLQRQARALGDPTRHSVFRYVVDAGRPVFVAELVEHLGFNHNSIRQHLAKLVDAGLVREQTSPAQGRGRPRLVYMVAPATHERWGAVGPYEQLSMWLAEIVRTGDSPVEVGRRVGAQVGGDEPGRESGGPTADPIGEFVDRMAGLGFEPSVRRRGEGYDVTLHACPFSSTAVADPATVCDLHLGLAQGVASRISGLVIDELEAKDPRRAQCHLRCHCAV